MPVEWSPVDPLVIAYGDARAEEATTECAAQIANLEAEISSLGAEVTELQTEAAGLEDAIDDLETTIADLEAQLAACQEANEPPAEPEGMWIGANVNVPGGGPTDNTLANFKAFNQQVGGTLTHRRSFPVIGQIVQSAWLDHAEGITPVVSLKKGPTVAAFADVAADLPPGTWFIPHHEPENAFARGAEYVTWYRSIFNAMMNANAELEIGPAHLGYAWRSSAGVGKAGINTGTVEPPSAWDVGDAYRAFVGLDVYARNGEPLATYPNFANWYAYFSQASAQPLRIMEYGTLATPAGGTYSAAREAAKAARITEDMDYLKTLPEVDAVLYWHATGDGDWSLQDATSRGAWAALAATGRGA